MRIMNNLMNKLKSKNTIKNLIGLLVGAVGGYLYYRFIGCNSGGCAITSNPYLTILWGAVIGYLLFDMFKIKPSSLTQDHTND